MGLEQTFIPSGKEKKKKKGKRGRGEGKKKGVGKLTSIGETVLFILAFAPLIILKRGKKRGGRGKGRGEGGDGSRLSWVGGGTFFFTRQPVGGEERKGGGGKERGRGRGGAVVPRCDAPFILSFLFLPSSRGKGGKKRGKKGRKRESRGTLHLCTLAYSCFLHLFPYLLYKEKKGRGKKEERGEKVGRVGTRRWFWAAFRRDSRNRSFFLIEEKKKEEKKRREKKKKGGEGRRKERDCFAVVRLPTTPSAPHRRGPSRFLKTQGKKKKRRGEGEGGEGGKQRVDEEWTRRDTIQRRPISAILQAESPAPSRVKRGERKGKRKREKDAAIRKTLRRLFHGPPLLIMPLHGEKRKKKKKRHQGDHAGPVPVRKPPMFSLKNSKKKKEKRKEKKGEKKEKGKRLNARTPG